MSYAPRTVVVHGPLALHMRRLDAARARAIGLQIVTLPQLAARLAGGFARPADAADLELAARSALADGGFSEITPLKDLPGMVRALLRTLDRVWRAGISLDAHRDDHPRLADLALIEARIRNAITGGGLILPDLLAAAMDRRHLFERLTGPVSLEHVHHVAPIWRPLVEALAGAVPVDWLNCSPPAGWAAGAAHADAEKSAAPLEIVTCAHPQAEVIEALRWARALLASGKASPAEIAIVAASPESWDDSMLGLVAGSGLPVHFSHGIPALCNVEGQACAALADLLAQGLSYGRVQRLLAHSLGRCPAWPDSPGQPLAGVAQGGALATLDQWRRALDHAAAGRSDQFDIAAMLMPALQLVSGGLEEAALAGEQLLPQGAAALWRTALRRASPAALPFTLSSLRVADGKDAGANIVWGPAAHVSGAPRPWVRLLGMTSRAWPRSRRDDPLLPENILPINPGLCPGRPEEDRRYFAAICNAASAGVSLSYARRTPQGGAQAPSPLLPPDLPRRRLGRLRIPEHAYSESDRLQARPRDGADQPRLARPVSCARARRRRELTPWDGQLRHNHPIILETLAQVQSASSLRQLLRDPQAFVWRYALGWHATLEETHTLSLSDQAFGEVVHQLLQYTVMTLENGSGFARAADHEIEEALDQASARVARQWPSMRPTPPPMLWRHTLDEAARLALVALKLDEFKAGTRSWTEVPFGEAGAGGTLPWDPEPKILIPGTQLAIRGWIDRLEIAAGDAAVRVTDYKTARAPANVQSLVLDGGKELQRALYSIAARHHLPDAALHADLVYLGDETPRRHKLEDPAAAISRVGELLNLATAVLGRGVSLPGPDAAEQWNPYRLARSAIGEPVNKEGAIGEAFGTFRQVWRER